MTPLLVLAVLGAAVLHAGWNTLVKKWDDKLTGVMLVQAGSTVCGLICIALLPAPRPESYPYIAASGVIHVIYFSLMTVVYRTAHLSVTYPITRGTAPLITSLATVLVLGEIPGARAIGAILCLSCGILWLAWDGIRTEGLDRRSFIAALANAFVIATYTVVDGEGGRLSQSPFVYNAWSDVATVVPFFAIAFALRGRSLIGPMAKGWKLAAVGGGASFLAYGIVIWAMTHAPIALVAALRETSALFGVALASLVLGERFGKSRYVAVVLVLVGLVIVRFYLI